MAGREPRVVLLLLALAAAGQAARLLLGRPGAPPGQVLAPESPADSGPARQRSRAIRAARPLAPGELVDLNTAPAEEIARLPRVGMSLAKRIVGDRSSRGLFRGPEDLDRVPGVGPGLLVTLANRVRFSPGAPLQGSRGSGANLSTPGAYGGRTVLETGAPIDLNLASEADLVVLPGIGLARARAILAYRRDKGPFAGVSDLGRVPGFSQSLVTRLAPLLMVR